MKRPAIFRRFARIASDCDYDTVLVEVEPDGPACHTGAYSCFGVEPALAEACSSLYALIERAKRTAAGRQLHDVSVQQRPRQDPEEGRRRSRRDGDRREERLAAARIVEETSDLAVSPAGDARGKGVTLEEIQDRNSAETTARQVETLGAESRTMQPDLEEVQKLREQGNVIPVYKSVIADFLTPVSAFLKLEKNRPYAFLLESVEGGETDRTILVPRLRSVSGLPLPRRAARDDFMQNLRATMARFRSVKLPNLPPFTGGAVGYFGYDMVRTIEDIPDTGRDDLGIDDAVLMFYKTILAFDHLRHQIHIISNLHGG